VLEYLLNLRIRNHFHFLQLSPNLRVLIFSMVNCTGVTWRSTSAAAIT